MKKILYLVVAIILLTFSRSDGQAKVEFTRWSLAHILSDYTAAPDYKSFITGGPVIEQLDSLGGVLLFYLTPQGNRDCRQAFRVGWRFGQSVHDLEEGKMVNVEVFSSPVVDTTKGYLDCFRPFGGPGIHDEGVKIRFRGADSLGLGSQPDLAFYWEQASPDLFKTDRIAEAVSDNDPAHASGSFLVQDLDKNPSTADIAFGTLAFDIEKKGAFGFRILYLYDGSESDLSPAGAHRLLIDKLVVDHTVAGDGTAPVMNISLMGLLEQAVGREVRIVIHFLDNYRRPLPGIEGDAAYCDSIGNAITLSPVGRISNRQYYLNELVMTMPYYALNLPPTKAGHTVYLYAEVFLDKKSIGMSRMTQTTFFW